MGFFADSRGQRVPRTLLVLLRLYLGAAFLVAAWPKVKAGADWVPRMVGFLERAVGQSYSFYQGFVTHTVLPNKDLFAALVAWGELLAGLALLAGAATRLAGLVALVLTANYLLLKGASLVSPSNDAAFIFMSLAVVLGAAGRAYGVDYWLARRWPRCPLW